jgi:hypothetical protein
LSETTFAAVKGDGVPEPNESFTVALNTPSPGTSLGTPGTTVITIVESSVTPPDTTKPATPVITSPAVNGNFNFAGSSLTVTGTATDTQGVDAVQVVVAADGGAPLVVSAVLANPNATSTQWTVGFGLGPVTNLVIQAVAFDAAGNASAVPATRTVKLLYPLEVRLGGNGTVSSGFAPRSFRQLGLSNTIAARPAAGSIFTGWNVSGASLSAMGLVSLDLLRPSLTFLHRQGVVLTANFMLSPFDSDVVGTYKGLVLPEGATPSSISTEGLINFTVTSTGAFSGTLLIDSQVFNLAGLFDQNGVARFGTARSDLFRVARSGKPPLHLACTMTFPAPFNTAHIDAELVEVDFRGVEVASSTSECFRAVFNGTTIVPSPNIQGTYTVILPAQPTGVQPPTVNDERFYPQGTGIATLTVARTGAVILSNCTLADGTAGVTASTSLLEGNVTPLFIPLYSRKGFLRAQLQFTNLPGSDVAPVTGTAARWSRPFINAQFYPEGWEEVIQVGFLGAKYTASTGASVMRAPDGADPGNDGDPLQSADADGNVLLRFNKGQLAATLDKGLKLSSADVVTKVPFNDPTYTMSVSRSTGIVTGTFRHTDTNTIPFRAIMFQKGVTAGAYGFFLTKQPMPIDYSGESGSVQLIGSP